MIDPTSAGPSATRTRPSAGASDPHTPGSARMGSWSVGTSLWRSGDRVKGVADGAGARGTWGQLRGRQPEAGVRARYGDSTAFAHQLAAGWMLDPARGAAGPGAAFEIMERLRARVLFENLLAAQGRREVPPDLRTRGMEVHHRISQLQKRLLDPVLGGGRGRGGGVVGGWW